MKREPGLDLLRVTAMFFVVSVHHFLYIGFYGQPQMGPFMWSADCFRWLFFCCNGLFMMLTGYLKSARPMGKDYYKSLVPILVSYVLCCAVSFPLQNSMLEEKLPLWEWVKRLFSFGNYAWYVEMYIGLILISPIINLALGQIQSRLGWYVIAGVLFCVTALPSLTPYHILPDYWTSLYPVTYYVLGAVIRQRQPAVKPRYALRAAGIICVILGFLSVLSTDDGLTTGYTQGHGGFWITLLSLSIFLALYRVRPGERISKILAWLSGGCFEGYLLSIVPDLWAYALVKQWHDPGHWILVYICVTVPIFAVSILAGKMVHSLASVLTGLLPGFRACKNAVR